MKHLALGISPSRLSRNESYPFENPLAQRLSVVELDWLRFPAQLIAVSTISNVVHLIYSTKDSLQCVKLLRFKQDPVALCLITQAGRDDGADFQLWVGTAIGEIWRIPLSIRFNNSPITRSNTKLTIYVQESDRNHFHVDFDLSSPFLVESCFLGITLLKAYLYESKVYVFVSGIILPAALYIYDTFSFSKLVDLSQFLSTSIPYLILLIDSDIKYALRTFSNPLTPNVSNHSVEFCAIFASDDGYTHVLVYNSESGVECRRLYNVGFCERILHIYASPHNISRLYLVTCREVISLSINEFDLMVTSQKICIDELFSAVVSLDQRLIIATLQSNYFVDFQENHAEAVVRKLFLRARISYMESTSNIIVAVCASGTIWKYDQSQIVSSYLQIREPKSKQQDLQNIKLSLTQHLMALSRLNHQETTLRHQHNLLNDYLEVLSFLSRIETEDLFESTVFAGLQGRNEDFSSLQADSNDQDISSGRAELYIKVRLPGSTNSLRKWKLNSSLIEWCIVVNILSEDSWNGLRENSSVCIPLNSHILSLNSQPFHTTIPVVVYSLTTKYAVYISLAINLLENAQKLDNFFPNHNLGAKSIPLHRKPYIFSCTDFSETPQMTLRKSIVRPSCSLEAVLDILPGNFCRSLRSNSTQAIQEITISFPLSILKAAKDDATTIEEFLLGVRYDNKWKIISQNTVVATSLLSNGDCVEIEFERDAQLGQFEHKIKIKTTNRWICQIVAASVLENLHNAMQAIPETTKDIIEPRISERIYVLNSRASAVASKLRIVQRNLEKFLLDSKRESDSKLSPTAIAQRVKEMPQLIASILNLYQRFQSFP